jgi:hypothetical protein
MAVAVADTGISVQTQHNLEVQAAVLVLVVMTVVVIVLCQDLVLTGKDIQVVREFDTVVKVTIATTVVVAVEQVVPEERDTTVTLTDNVQTAVLEQPLTF